LRRGYDLISLIFIEPSLYFRGSWPSIISPQFATTLRMVLKDFGNLLRRNRDRTTCQKYWYDGTHKPLGPARLSCIHMVFPTYLTSTPVHTHTHQYNILHWNSCHCTTFISTFRCRLRSYSNTTDSDEMFTCRNKGWSRVSAISYLDMTKEGIE
jgi:hypothetical protein